LIFFHSHLQLIRPLGTCNILHVKFMQ